MNNRVMWIERRVLPAQNGTPPCPPQVFGGFADGLVANSNDILRAAGTSRPGLSPAALHFLACALVLLCACAPAFPESVSSPPALSATDPELSALLAAYRDGFYEFCQQQCERLLKSQPPPDPAVVRQTRLVLACSLIRQRQLQRALEELVTLDRAGDPSLRPQVLYWMGEAHEAGGDITAARRYYRQVATEFPRSDIAPAAWLAVAWSLYEEGDYRGSLDTLRQLAERYPDWEGLQEVELKTAECFYQLEKYDVARVELEQWLTQYPNSGQRLEATFWLGQARMALEEYREAADLFGQMLEGDLPREWEPWVLHARAWALYRIQDWDASLRHFQLLTEYHPDSPLSDSALFYQAHLALLRGQPEQASEWVQTLVRRFPDSPWSEAALLMQADAWANARRFDAALSGYAQALGRFTRPDQQAAALYGMAWVYREQGLWAPALESLDRVNEGAGSVWPEAQLLRADIQMAQGKLAEATETLDRVLDRQILEVADEAQFMLGEIFYRRGQWDSALAAWTSLRRNFPDSPLFDRSLYRMGWGQFRQGHFLEAAKHFRELAESSRDPVMVPAAILQECVSLYNAGQHRASLDRLSALPQGLEGEGSGIPQAGYLKGWALFQLGRSAEAVQEFDVLLQKYPSFPQAPEVLLWLGQYYYRQGDLVGARPYFERLLKEYPSVQAADQAAYWSGWIEYRQGNTSQAVARFQEMIKRFPTSQFTGDALFRLANILSRQGQADEAQLYYEKALVILPQGAKAEVYTTMGQWYESRGLGDQAESAYLTVIYQYANQLSWCVPAGRQLGRMYESAQKRDRAVQIYRTMAQWKDPEAQRIAKERLAALGVE